MKHEIDRLLAVVERFLVEGGAGGVSLEGALQAAGSLRVAMEKESVKGKWYKHRIVKRKVVPMTMFHSDPPAVEAMRALHREIEGETDVYLRSHKPCQKQTDSFYTYGQNGLMAVVAVTLYGPGSMRDEILEELVRGEIIEKGEMR